MGNYEVDHDISRLTLLKTKMAKRQLLEPMMKLFQDSFLSNTNSVSPQNIPFVKSRQFLLTVYGTFGLLQYTTIMFSDDERKKWLGDVLWPVGKNLAPMYRVTMLNVTILLTMLPFQVYLIETTTGFQVLDFLDNPYFIEEDNHRKLLKMLHTCCKIMRAIHILFPICGSAFVVSCAYHIISEGEPNDLILLYLVSSLYPIGITYLVYPVVLSCGALLLCVSLYMRYSYEALRPPSSLRLLPLKIRKLSQLQHIVAKVNRRSKWILGSLGFMSVPSIAATWHLFQDSSLAILLLTVPMLCAFSVGSIAICAVATSVHHSAMVSIAALNGYRIRAQASNGSWKRIPMMMVSGYNYPVGFECLTFGLFTREMFFDVSSIF
ncbi:hypothetical protein HDE_08485 [Halotydeus destructor]|nr:hypothetical protein HDE_08485 [Halotydeus destructor]